MAVPNVPGIHHQVLFGAAVMVAALPLLNPAAQAGSITASSIWDKNNAIARAQEQMPAGAVVSAKRCQEIEVRGYTRYLCTLEFTQRPLQD
ncbi:hypothetical protein [Synechococcus sp. CBW1108]|uniref:hypothetical protein n=1 Tax=Synechococcus sp. CBW1108 TaxID=1353147 RepID=UPI001E555A6F|nr:hypothetical protein [Synechococcus sp. CBW1108]